MQDPTKELVRIEVLLLCIDRAQADRVHARYREQSAPLVSCFSAKYVGTGRVTAVAELEGAAHRATLSRNAADYRSGPKNDELPRKVDMRLTPIRRFPPIRGFLCGLRLAGL